MILQALTNYYYRKRDTGEGALAPPGFEKKEIPFLIVLNTKGGFVDLEDTRDGEGKKRIGRVFTVPQGVKRSSGIDANLLWDNTAYVLGIPSQNEKDREEQRRKKLLRAVEQHSNFTSKVRALFELTKDQGVSAVAAFLERANYDDLLKHPIWQDLSKSAGNVSFRLDGETDLVCQRPALRQALEAGPDSNSEQGRCLITGEMDVIERLHPSIKGVWGGQPSGGNIVAVNTLESPAFGSYGKEQGFNSPIGKRAAFAYTTALNSLLTKGSRQRIQVGDASTVFWADKTHPLESLLADLFDEPPKDDPDRNTEAVKTLYAAPKAGMIPFGEDATRFFVLGLSPNASRISIRFWHAGPVSDIAGNIRQHFEDIRIVHPSFKPETPSLFRLLVSLAAQEKSDNIPPNLAGDVMKAILEGTLYPITLLQSAVTRIRAEQSQKEVTYERASLIKAVLVREDRYYNKKAKEVTVSLDETNSNIGYRLGRLFAVLERAQEAASPDINATIRDRFYGAASSTPVTVFPQLMKLKNHHIAKLDNRGQAVNLEKQLGQIMEAVSEFPAHLNLPDQGRFAVGYYHQRQAFFTPRKESNKEGE